MVTNIQEFAINTQICSLRYIVREKTNVPVPKVLAWSVQAKTNSVGAEYMVMEAAPGVPLYDVWSRMSGLQQAQCKASLARIVKEMYSLDFAVFGSLYFNTPDRPAGAIPLDAAFCIGPNCARQHWGYDQEKAAHMSTLEGRQGPCKLDLPHITHLSYSKSRKGVI
jgi:hypothetical protein